MYSCFKDLPIATLDKLRLQQKLDSDATYEYAFDPRRNLTTYISEWVAERKKRNANFYFDVYGITGSGKTYAMLYLVKSLHPTFTNDLIFFGSKELMRGIHNVKHGDIILNDDKTRDFGLGSNRRASEYANVIQVVRKYELSLVNTATSPRLFENANYLFESLYIDYDKKKSRFAVQTCDSSRFGIRTIGWAEFGDPRDVMTPEEITKYEERKDQFIEENLRKKGTDDIDIAAREIIENSELFKGVESQYLALEKSIPKSTLFEIVATYFNYLNRNNEVEAIVSRLKLIGISERKWKV